MYKIEKYKYEGKIPKQWEPYFQYSVKGEEYTILKREDGFLSMCDTEYEFITNKHFFKAVVDKGPHCTVLIYGYGIGYVLPFIKPYCSRIVILEMNKEVLALQRLDSEVEVILGDAFTTDVEGEFDIIYSDTDLKTGFNPKHKLKADGLRLQWNHKQELRLNKLT